MVKFVAISEGHSSNTRYRVYVTGAVQRVGGRTLGGLRAARRANITPIDQLLNAIRRWIRMMPATIRSSAQLRTHLPSHSRSPVVTVPYVRAVPPRPPAQWSSTRKRHSGVIPFRRWLSLSKRLRCCLCRWGEWDSGAMPYMATVSERDLTNSCRRSVVYRTQRARRTSIRLMVTNNVKLNNRNLIPIARAHVVIRRNDPQFVMCWNHSHGMSCDNQVDSCLVMQ